MQAASTQIALFVSDIQEHLEAEKNFLQNEPLREGSFQEGFLEGMRFWQRAMQQEEDFYGALSLLEKLIRPLGLRLLCREKPQKAYSVSSTREGLLEAIEARKEDLLRLQKELLEIPSSQVEESFEKETLSDFEDNLNESLQKLLS